MIKGLVNRIIPFSSVDGPGNRTAIFLQGCNFNCLYCHNPETINICNNCSACVRHCPYGALSSQNNEVIWDSEKCRKCDICLKVCPNCSSPKAVLMDVAEVVNEVKKVRSFISGVTISGGECTLQSEFLEALFEEIKKMNLTAFVDTNGSVPFWEMPGLTSLMDMAMVDIKSFDLKEHIRLTGKDNINVLKNVEYLSRIGKLYEVRTVIVPDILDNYRNVNGISKLIASLDPDIRYKLIKYRPFGVRKDKMESKVPSDGMMNELAEIATANGCKSVVIT